MSTKDNNSEALQQRISATLGEESAPADPNGLAEVMARTRKRRGLVVPVWQAAAAVILVGLLAWWGRGLDLEKAGGENGMIAMVDTVVQEVRLVDTVFLPSPEKKVERVVDKKVISPAVKRGPQTPKTSPVLSTPPKLAEAIAALPKPDVIERRRGTQAGAIFQTDGLVQIGDKFSGGY